MNGAGTPTPAPLFSGRAPESEEHHAAASEYNIPLAYLRAFIIVLVVLHHTAVAYLLPAAPPIASSLADNLHSIRGISPVIDGQHSKIFFFIVFINDRFFMPLLFFLSGLFVWGSLKRKGRLVFCRDRLIRLGLPFVVMVILAPLTYYTTYLQSGSISSTPGFWQQWFALGNWPTGPAWFIWLLFAFDIFTILLSALIPGGIGFFEKMMSFSFRRAAAFFWLIFIASAVSYIPMATIYDPNFSWWYWGPFSFQSSRIFLYLIYFLIGVVLGAYGIHRTLLAPNSTLARRWIMWVGAALAVFLANFTATFARSNQTVIAVSFLLFCAAACIAFLAIFLKFAGKRSRILDHLFINSYGIYVIHYAVVSWLLYAMLTVHLPAFVKGSIVFVCALTFCWGIISLIRRIPGVARVI